MCKLALLHRCIVHLMAQFFEGALLTLQLVVVIIEALDRLCRVDHEAEWDLPDQVCEARHKYQSKYEQVVCIVMD